MTNLVYRLHQWCAERIPGVQFPRPIPRRPAAPVFRYPVPLAMRFPLFMLGLAMIGVGVLCLLFAAVLLYSVVGV